MAPIALLLGAGPNIGASTAKEFSSSGYQVVVTSRKAPADANPSYSYVQGDLSQPESVENIFSHVRKLHGEPSVVVYNAAGFSLAAADNPFEVDLATFEEHLNLNTTSVFLAIKQALKSFETLPASSARTFIYTGNAMNFAPFPGRMTLGTGKSATAHMIASAAQAYGPKGYKFYYADERQPNGKLGGRGISGEAHAKLFKQLAEDEAQGPWLQTFVSGKGYVKFAADTDVTL
ncbi:unnamed protein product [Periconia digitata]|uniref:Short-chain dehydrogenase n=1 Tax=Periconia digitata TaxID=1303443 RepID=A0A9W4XRY8_9PLEO|nr:unnamed protein product [Periconia digitata]